MPTAKGLYPQFFNDHGLRSLADDFQIAKAIHNDPFSRDDQHMLRMLRIRQQSLIGLIVCHDGIDSSVQPNRTAERVNDNETVFQTNA